MANRCLLDAQCLKCLWVCSSAVCRMTWRTVSLNRLRRLKVLCLLCGFIRLPYLGSNGGGSYSPFWCSNAISSSSQVMPASSAGIGWIGRFWRKWAILLGWAVLGGLASGFEPSYGGSAELDDVDWIGCLGPQSSLGSGPCEGCVDIDIGLDCTGGEMNGWVALSHGNVELRDCNDKPLDAIN